MSRFAAPIRKNDTPGVVITVFSSLSQYRVSTNLTCTQVMYFASYFALLKQMFMFF